MGAKTQFSSAEGQKFAAIISETKKSNFLLHSPLAPLQSWVRFYRLAVLRLSFPLRYNKKHLPPEQAPEQVANLSRSRCFCSREQRALYFKERNRVSRAAAKQNKTWSRTKTVLKFDLKQNERSARAHCRSERTFFKENLLNHSMR